MRKLLLGAVVTTVLAVMLAGSARPDAETGSPTAPADVLFLRSGDGVALVRTGAEPGSVRLPRTTPAIDWSMVVRTIPRRTSTRVVAVNLDGTRRWSGDVPAGLEAKVVAADGRWVALGPVGGDAGYPVGRRATTLAIVDGRDQSYRAIELRGNYEPEAFSTDGTSLFVVEYLPPRQPTHYRVRRLDLATEQVEGVYTVDGHLQEAMGGTARIQVASPDGERLYTLYQLRAPGGVRRAFVHVLDLKELWAHCVELPTEFDTARDRSVALAVSPDGTRLYAADATSGTVAEIDTVGLAVARTGRAGFGSAGGSAHAVAADDGRLYLAKGSRLLALDDSTLDLERQRELDGRVTGLQASIDGRRLFVGVAGEVVILNTRTGLQAGVLDPSELGGFDQLGRSTRWIEEILPKRLTCAC